MTETGTGAESESETESVVAGARENGSAGDRAPPAAKGARFGSGWVYLGKEWDGVWEKRHFDGWGAGLPAVGDVITARGRSNVRIAEPDDLGALARVRTTVGAQHPVEVLQVQRWAGGNLVWARVRSTW